MELARGFERYVERLALTLGHADRVGPMRDYARGLMLSGERKSVEPMAALVAPAGVSAKHQSLHHFVSQAEWSDAALLEEVRAMVVPQMGSIEAWIIDDTGYPKKGRHSVGVARQYCGQLGKQDNCQVAVSLSVANDGASLPIAYQLYLPKEWAEDEARRSKAGIPEDIAFATKTALALKQLRAASRAKVPRGVVLADAGYGNDTDFRTGVRKLGLTYAVGIQSTTTVWANGDAPMPPKRYGGRGRRPSRPRRGVGHAPLAAKTLAEQLPTRQYRTVRWREGKRGWLSSRFARVRVRAAHRDEGHPEEWLLIEWPSDEAAATKYWLSTMPHNVSFRDLVRRTKLRWRIERDYQELKQELGLGHYEGRNWRGFHHHASLCIAAYGFLVGSRLRRGKKNSIALADLGLQAPHQPANFIPRGSPRAA